MDCLLFFHMSSHARFIYLERWVTTAAPQPLVEVKKIQLFLLILTFLLESTSRVTMALHVGSMVLFKVCSMILNMMKNMGEWWEITLLL